MNDVRCNCQSESHSENCRLRPVTVGDLAKMQQQIDEIHRFVSAVAEALNNPMIKAMIPPNLRSLVG